MTGLPSYTSPYADGGHSDHYAADLGLMAPPDRRTFGPYADVSAGATTLGANTGTKAHITVTAPADARIWFDGALTETAGSVREFESPPLTPGNAHAYIIKASWTRNGSEVTQAQTVPVSPGAHVKVEFPIP